MVYSLFTIVLSVAAVIPLISASPIPLFGIHIGAGKIANGNTSPVAQATIDSTLLRPALFSRAAYCSAASVTALSCGAPCDAIKTIKVLQAGGDDGAIPGCMS